MDAFRKQASKLRDSVAKQQQAVLKTFSGSQAPQHSDTIVTDEAELQRHHQLERLYASTKAAKHYQREIIKGLEGIVATGAKQLEVSSKLGDECRKYGAEGPGTGGALGRASVQYAGGQLALQKERDALHRNVMAQVAEPLRGMVTGAPLDDARALANRYDKLRQDAESQVTEVSRRAQRAREGGPKEAESAQRLEQAEQRMGELTAAMGVLGKEAGAAMSAVEAQQQRLTLQRLIALVEAERSYHQRAADILDELQAQMVSERQRNDAAPPGGAEDAEPGPAQSQREDGKGNGVPPPGAQRGAGYFLAEVVHPFDAEQAGELSLTAGDYIVVRQVAPSGWSEGESKGSAGWFPSAYVERRQRVPASKIVEAGVAF